MVVPRAPGVVFGVNANSQDSVLGDQQNAAKALGVGWLREEIRWPAVEPREGHFDDRRYDRVVTAAAHRHLRILPLLFLSPPWLSAQKTAYPPSLPAWQSFVRHVVARYGPGGVFWRAHPRLDGSLAMTVYEVWNEPYYEYFAAGKVDAAAYARLVRAAISAGHQVDPHAAFLAAMETRYTAADGTTRDWADDVFGADPGLAKLLGGIAVHPYTQGSPTDPDPSGDQLPFDRVQTLLADYRAKGGEARRPLWVTELGWSTCPTRPLCVSPATQARYWAAALRALARPPLRTQVGGVFAYSLRSFPRAGPTDPLGDFGLLDVAGRRKPAWSVYRAAAVAAARPASRK